MAVNSKNVSAEDKNKPIHVCDLAIEARELLAVGRDDNPDEGITVEETEKHGYISVTRVKVENEKGEAAIGKPVGRYITIQMPSGFYGQRHVYEQMCGCCAEELKALTDGKIGDDDCVLVVGLGNVKITADSLGPKAVGGLMITRHLKQYIPDKIDKGVRPVCAIAPGVLGTTGMETEEIVYALTQMIRPSLVIVIDALCSGSIERINTTVQITDTGITPGGGVGNKRKTINSQTLGVPVIALGVPTVVDAATIARAGIELAEKNRKYGEDTKEKENIKYREYTSAEHNDAEKPRDDAFGISDIHAAVDERFGNLIVAPKEVDSIVNDIASVIADGINIALHKGIDFEDIGRYM